MRLVDADAFKKILSEHEMEHDKRRNFDDYACGAANAYEYASDLLDDMPTVERPHGEWIMHKNFDGHLRFYECSNCGNTQGYLSNFCEVCGSNNKEK